MNTRHYETQQITELSIIFVIKQIKMGWVHRVHIPFKMGATFKMSYMATAICCKVLPKVIMRISTYRHGYAESQCAAVARLKRGAEFL
jgi:hypothetical protein